MLYLIIYCHSAVVVYLFYTITPVESFANEVFKDAYRVRICMHFVALFPPLNVGVAAVVALGSLHAFIKDLLS